MVFPYRVVICWATLSAAGCIALRFPCALNTAEANFVSDVDSPDPVRIAVASDWFSCWPIASASAFTSVVRFPALEVRVSTIPWNLPVVNVDLPTHCDRALKESAPPYPPRCARAYSSVVSVLLPFAAGSWAETSSFEASVSRFVPFAPSPAAAAWVVSASRVWLALPETCGKACVAVMLAAIAALPNVPT